jgi:hypothetical protein
VGGDAVDDVVAGAVLVVVRAAASVLSFEFGELDVQAAPRTSPAARRTRRRVTTSS